MTNCKIVRGHPLPEDPAPKVCTCCPVVTEPGDVEMCVHCWQWWYRGGPILPQTAAEFARAKMDNDECLAALDRAAHLMEMDR